MNVKSLGYDIVENVIEASIVSQLADHFEAVASTVASVERNGNTYGIRNILRDHAIVRRLADSSAMRALIDPVLGTDAIAVRGILFDKTPGANWKVPWHQDLSIAV